MHPVLRVRLVLLLRLDHETLDHVAITCYDADLQLIRWAVFAVAPRAGYLCGRSIYLCGRRGKEGTNPKEVSCIVNVVCCILAGHEDDSLLLLPCWIVIRFDFLSRPLFILHEGYLPCTNPSSPSSSSSISPDVFEPSTSPTCRVVISNSRDLPNAGCFLHDQNCQCQTVDTRGRRFTRASALTSLVWEQSIRFAQYNLIHPLSHSPYGL